jgi:hypothetical protein
MKALSKSAKETILMVVGIYAFIIMVISVGGWLDINRHTKVEYFDVLTATVQLIIVPALLSVVAVWYAYFEETE